MVERRLLSLVLLACLGGAGAKPTGHRHHGLVPVPSPAPEHHRPTASLLPSPVPSPAPQKSEPPPPPPPMPFAEALAAGAEDNNGNLTFAPGKLLPAVKCIEYMAVIGSKEVPIFTAQMQALGLWDRVTVHLAQPDPDGKEAGCFRAHVNAWNSALARGCESALMVEEDLYFNEAVVEQSFASANAMVASGSPYDMLFLGYAAQVDTTHGLLRPLLNASLVQASVAKYDDDKYQCVYRLHNWLCTQSYIISRPTMERWKNLTYVVNQTEAIDLYLATKFDSNAFFAVSPMAGFQRYHPPPPGEIGGAETGSPMETWKFVPGVVYSIYEPILWAQKAGILRPDACLAPAAAYSYTGLDTAVQEFDHLHGGQIRSVRATLPHVLKELRHYRGPTSIYDFNTTVNTDPKTLGEEVGVTKALLGPKAAAQVAHQPTLTDTSLLSAGFFSDDFSDFSDWSPQLPGVPAHTGKITFGELFPPLPGQRAKAETRLQ